MARSQGRSSNPEGRKKRTTVTTIETREVWIVRGIPECSGKELLPERRALPEIVKDTTPREGEEKDQ